MELIVLYLLACITTSIACMISLFSPVIADLQLLDTPPQVVQGFNKHLLMLVLGVITAIVAPFMLLIYFSKPRSDSFREALYMELQKN